MFKLIIFDLDGTLTESKQKVDNEMAGLVCNLLSRTKVAVISGGNFPQFQKQFIEILPCQPSVLENLYIAPLSGGSLFTFKKGQWTALHEDLMSKEERKKITDAFETVFKETNFVPAPKIYGALIEDRGGQITFSGLGQDAPPELKKQWDPVNRQKLILKTALDKYLPEFEVRMGGSTSIDVSHKGINKAYGIHKISKYLSIPENEMLFVGDAIYEGGNDFPATQTGAATQAVKDVEETKKLIRDILTK